MARSDASVSIRDGFSVSNIFRAGSWRHSFLNFSNAFYSSLPYCYSILLVAIFVRLVRGIAALEYPRINFRLQFTNPRKLCTSFTLVGAFYSFTACSFIRSMRIPFRPIINPRKLISSIQNLYFSGLRRNSRTPKYSRILLICS